MIPTLVHVIPTLENAGAETVLARLTEEFHKFGYHQIIISTKGFKSDFFYEKLLPYCSLFVWKTEKEQTLKYLQSLPKQTVILGWMYDGIYFSYRLKWQYGFKFHVVWTIRQSNFQKTQIKQKIGLFAFGLFSQLLRPKIIYNAYTSQFTHSNFFFYNNNSNVIQNGLAKKDNNVCKLNIDIPPKFLLFVSRYDPIKGIDRLLRIVALFFKEHTEYKLIIAGGGWQNCHIPKALHNQVVILGNVPFVNELYQKASVYLFTSYFEGYPNVVVEATCNGCPIIAFEAGDAASILKDYALGQTVTSEKQFLEQLFKQTRQPPSHETRQEEAKKQKERFQFKHTVNAYKAFIFDD